MQANLSRRQLLKMLSLSGASMAMPAWAEYASRQPLIIPPLLTNKKGKPFFLTAETSQTTLWRNKVTVWGFNGQYLAPTLFLQRGEFAKFTWKNHLNERLAINLQGLQTPGELSGGFSHTLNPGQSWAPVIPITQPAGCCFYHACTWQQSAYQTYRGLAGLCIIEDPKEKKNQLPQQYGVNDIPLILQDLQLNDQGEQLFQVDNYQFLGHRLFVNGVENPFFKAPTELLRLRLVNASVSRTYHLRFADRRKFDLIAQDQGFLSQNLTVQGLTLAPSERAEILVNMSNGGSAKLLAGEKPSFLAYYFKRDLLQENTVLEIRTSGLASAFPAPKNFRFTTDAQQMLKAPVARTRLFKLNTQNATINGQSFDPRRLDIRCKKGSVERWVIQSDAPTGFRLQGAKFIVEKVGDTHRPREQLAWKDSVYVNKEVQLLVRFDHHCTNKFPFIFGASNLCLADAGCLGIFVVE